MEGLGCHANARVRKGEIRVQLDPDCSLDCAQIFSWENLRNFRDVCSQYSGENMREKICELRSRIFNFCPSYCAEKLGSNQGPIRFQIVTYGSKMGCRCRLVSISYELLSPFHGGNTGSNPVGDANKIKKFRETTVFLHDPI